MKEVFAEYLEGSFIDYKNEEHKIIVCAVCIDPRDSIETYTNFAAGPIDVDYYMIEKGFCPITKALSIGATICNPDDTYNFEKGKKIAYYRALNNLPVLYSNKPITKTLAKAALVQEIAFIKEFPEKLIKGYKDSKTRYLNRLSAKEQYKELNDEEQFIVDEALKGVNLDKCLKVFKSLEKYNYNDIKK